MDFSRRLITIVDEQAEGNSKKFAEKAGLKQATFHNYLKGRLPKADVLQSICETYKVNLNWLVAGLGPKYFPQPGELQVSGVSPEVTELLGNVERMLAGGHPLAFDAIEQNIRYLDYLMAVEERADQAEREVREIRKTMSRITSDMAAQNMKSKHPAGKTRGETGSR